VARIHKSDDPPGVNNKRRRMNGYSKNDMFANNGHHLGSCKLTEISAQSIVDTFGYRWWKYKSPSRCKKLGIVRPQINVGSTIEHKDNLVLVHSIDNGMVIGFTKNDDHKYYSCEATECLLHFNIPCQISGLGEPKRGDVIECHGNDHILVLCVQNGIASGFSKNDHGKIDAWPSNECVVVQVSTQSIANKFNQSWWNALDECDCRDLGLIRTKIVTGCVVTHTDNIILVQEITDTMITGFSKDDGRYYSCKISECILRSDIFAQSVATTFSSLWWMQFDLSDCHALNIIKPR